MKKNVQLVRDDPRFDEAMRLLGFDPELVIKVTVDVGPSTEEFLAGLGIEAPDAV